jgi:hypothetical protein
VAGNVAGDGREPVLELAERRPVLFLGYRGGGGGGGGGEKVEEEYGGGGCVAERAPAMGGHLPDYSPTRSWRAEAVESVSVNRELCGGVDAEGWYI